MRRARIIVADVRDGLRSLEDESVQSIVTSPPYWQLRDYEVEGQIGSEPSPEAYVATMLEVFREARRVLRSDGTLWLNLGDCYISNAPGNDRPDHSGPVLHPSRGNQESTRAARKGRSFRRDRKRRDDEPHRRAHGRKPKDLVGIPWLMALALQTDGWWLRRDIVWAKGASFGPYNGNPMPESPKDRPSSAHEYLFLLTKSERYFYDRFAVREPLASSPEEYARAAASVRANHDYGEVCGRPLGEKSFAEVPDGRNLRSVWTIPTAAFPGEFCRRCRTYFPSGFRKMRRGDESQGEDDGERKKPPCPKCGSRDDWLGHYATFPVDLIEPCIRLGTSEGGACSACGAPLERVVEKRGTGRFVSAPTGWDTSSGFHGSLHRGGRSVDSPQVELTTTETVGWEPTCRCGAPTRPCIVLDFFHGAGTSGLVSLRLERDYRGIELNPDYAEMSVRRLEGDAPLFNRVEIRTL